MLEAEYAFSNEKFQILGCTFTENSTRLLVFLLEKNNSVSCKAIKIRSNYRDSDKTVLDNFVIKKYLEELSTNNFQEISAVAQILGLKTV